jgi:hypothetical protein
VIPPPPPPPRPEPMGPVSELAAPLAPKRVASGSISHNECVCWRRKKCVGGCVV